jgi:uncharacterized protein (TIGR02145 family)
VTSIGGTCAGSQARQLLGCGAFIAPGVYKDFACFNLGATDETLDPNTPVQQIHGNYYQWGRSGAVATASTGPGTIGGWNSSSAANGAWLEASKTANDPCPTGFRVPTNAQWNGVLANNTISRTGSWEISATNYTTAIHWGPDASNKTLTLPAAGYRNISDGALFNHGGFGYYWSSNESNTQSWYLDFSSNTVMTGENNREFGFSVRCISE